MGKAMEYCYSVEKESAGEEFNKKENVFLIPHTVYGDGQNTYRKCDKHTCPHHKTHKRKTCTFSVATREFYFYKKYT